MKSLFGDLDAVLPAHADLDAGDGPEVVGRNLGARLGAARGGHPAAPVPGALVLHGGHLGLGLADLELLPRPWVRFNRHFGIRAGFSKYLRD